MSFRQMNKQPQTIIELKDIRKLLQLALSNWYIIVGSLLLSAIAGYCYITITNAGFLARSRVSTQYKDKTNEDYSQDGIIRINSHQLIEKTLESIQMDVSYYQPDTILSGKLDGKYYEIFDSLPFRASIGVVDKELYEKEIKIKIINDTVFELTYAWNGQMIIQKGYFDSIVSTPQLRLGILKGELVGIPDNEYAIQIYDKEEVIEKIQNKLDAVIPKDLTELVIEYRDVLPKRAVAFLDALSKTYIQDNIKLQIKKNGKMVAGIDKLLQKTEMVLRNVQDSILRNKKLTGFDENLEEQKSVTLLTNLMVDKKKLEYQRMSMTDLENYLLKNNDLGLPPPYFDGNEDPFIQKCLGQLYNIELNKKDNLFNVTDKSISLVQGDYNFETRKTNLLKYIKNTQQVLEVKIADMDKQIAVMMAPGSMEYNKYQLYAIEMQRQLKANETMYMNLLEKRNNILIAQAAIDPEYLIVESPHLIRTDDTRKKNTNTMGSFLLVGLAAASMIIFLKHLFYERIESIEDLKEKQSVIPVLGELVFINAVKEPFPSMIDAHSHPLVSSLLRIIRTNIDYALPGKNSKTILITSHTPSEGKTFTAVNIGAILSMTNKKVLILDMDLHKPNVHKALGIAAVKYSSMTEVYEKKCNIKDAIINTSQPNLDAVIAESSIKNAPEMLLSDVTKTIMDYGSKHYDYVIIDTPPVGLTTDALTLMKYSDINIYVINSAFPYKNSISQANEIASHNKFKLFYLLNKVKHKKLQYYSKHYKYYKYAYASISLPKEFAISPPHWSQYDNPAHGWSGFADRFRDILRGRRDAD